MVLPAPTGEKNTRPRRERNPLGFSRPRTSRDLPFGLVDRDWRLVIDVNVGGSPREIRGVLASQFDVEREDRTILCYGRGIDDPAAVTDAILRMLAEADLYQVVIQPFRVERWSEELLQYVDSEAPDEDAEEDSWTGSEIAPQEIHWVVRVKPVSVFEERRVRREVRARGRPITARTSDGFEVGARDRADAMDLAIDLGDLPQVAFATPRSLGWLQRWLLRQRLAGTYWSESGDFFYYHDGGVGGDGGGWGDGGGGGHGH